MHRGIIEPNKDSCDVKNLGKPGNAEKKKGNASGDVRNILYLVASPSGLCNILLLKTNEICVLKEPGTLENSRKFYCICMNRIQK